jgi:hypothetical protein
MANQRSDIQIAILAALQTVFILIALLFIAQGIFNSGFKIGATEGAKATINLCQSGHPSCWPSQPRKKEPPVERT